jgi:hypothetical protein
MMNPAARKRPVFLDFLRDLPTVRPPTDEPRGANIMTVQIEGHVAAKVEIGARFLRRICPDIETWIVEGGRLTEKTRRSLQTQILRAATPTLVEAFREGFVSVHLRHGIEVEQVDIEVKRAGRWNAVAFIDGGCASG